MGKRTAREAPRPSPILACALALLGALPCARPGSRAEPGGRARLRGYPSPTLGPPLDEPRARAWAPPGGSAQARARTGVARQRVLPRRPRARIECPVSIDVGLEGIARAAAIRRGRSSPRLRLEPRAKLFPGHMVLACGLAARRGSPSPRPSCLRSRAGRGRRPDELPSNGLDYDGVSALVARIRAPSSRPRSGCPPGLDRRGRPPRGLLGEGGAGLLPRLAGTGAGGSCRKRRD